MVAPIEYVAEHPIQLPTADVESSYVVLFLVFVVGGRRMGGGVSLTLPPCSSEPASWEAGGGVT